MQIVEAADLFCGAGGTSSGLLEAAKELGLQVKLTAVNHWPIAIETHSANHPSSRHLCTELEMVNPRKSFPSGKLDLLVASPECTGHSNARGGKPTSDQSRSTAWHILHWADALDIAVILIENVPEFKLWGPLDKEGKPIPSKKGVLYRRFLGDLRALGYTVDERILNCADYGDATTRKRLFLLARKGRKRIEWPQPSHFPPASLNLYDGQPWRSAREIIDWEREGTSIYDRKKPLAPATMARIYAGLRKFCGLPFVIGAGGPQGAGQPRSVEDPLGTVLAENHKALCQPFLVVFRNHQNAQSLDRPLPAMTTSGANFGLAQPYLIALEHLGEGNGDERRCYGMERPLPTVTAKGQFGLCEPYLIKYYAGSDAVSLDDPLPTVTANYEHLALCQAFIIPIDHNSHTSGARSMDAPLSTITAEARHALIQPYLVAFHGGPRGYQRIRDLDQPLPTQDTSNRFGLCTPFLIRFYGSERGAVSVDVPLGTVTSKDTFGLALPEWLDKGDQLFWLDIKFRMLHPTELARAHSFPPTYSFRGIREHQVKQIGNSVPVQTAKALCLSALSMLGYGSAGKGEIRCPGI